MIELPKKIFFTGAPGSKWSGAGQMIESIPWFNSTDRSSVREYFDGIDVNGGDTNDNGQYLRHCGAYFGPGMEFEARVSEIEKAFVEPAEGCMLAKSHHWAYQLDNLKEKECNEDGDWIMMVYRPSMASFSWWMTVGGFARITYPNYDWYENETKMFYEIEAQNNAMLKFAYQNKLVWESFTSEWILKHTGREIVRRIPGDWHDVLVTVYKP